jgi:hypothetical protein
MKRSANAVVLIVVSLVAAITITGLFTYVAAHFSVNALDWLLRFEEQYPGATKGVCFFMIYFSLLLVVWKKRRTSKAT